ncbi:MAG: hypothetical protein IJV40_08810 [Oscillospiraceae bacterium]|nr:hypothetical protein [Oscillospiraceae bacterium]
MKRNLRIILAALAAYVLLVVLLFAVEYRAPSAGIHSIWDAVWYSLITMTTVGYGDIAPVTPFGRLIGALFALCSVGIFAALIGLGIHMIGGQLLPRLKLMDAKNKPWYVFNEVNEDSLVLADALQRQEDCAVIFLEGERKERLPGAVILNTDFESLIARFSGKKTASFFFMGDDPWQNYSNGLLAADRGMQAYSMSSAAIDRYPANLHLFCREDALSRFYWQQHPLRREERCVVLIGCGCFGSALLERALLTNVYEPDRTVEYHVFEDTACFQAMHSELAQVLSGEKTGEDRLVFHEDSWTDCRDLILRADRVIICQDSDTACMSTYETMKKWYVAVSPIHVRLSADFAGITAFGERAQVLTPEFVMKDLVNRQAIMMNDIYNEGSANPTAWNDLNGYYRASNIAAADHMIVKVRYLLEDDDLTVLTREDCLRAYERYKERYAESFALFEEIEHRRWMRFSQMYNWQYADTRDNARRLHPLMVPYEQLSEEEKRKDDFAWELLGRMKL